MTLVTGKILEKVLFMILYSKKNMVIFTSILFGFVCVFQIHPPFVTWAEMRVFRGGFKVDLTWLLMVALHMWSIIVFSICVDVLLTDSILLPPRWSTPPWQAGLSLVYMLQDSDFTTQTPNRFWVVMRAVAVVVEGSYLIVTRHTSPGLSHSLSLRRHNTRLCLTGRGGRESIAARRRLTSVTLHASWCAMTSCRNVKWCWGGGRGGVCVYTVSRQSEWHVTVKRKVAKEEEKEEMIRGIITGASLHLLPVAHVCFCGMYFRVPVGTCKKPKDALVTMTGDIIFLFLIVWFMCV